MDNKLYKIHGADTKNVRDYWIKINQLDVTCFIISLFTAQHISNVSTSIFRRLRLICGFISCVIFLWFDVCWCSGVVRLGCCGILMQAEDGCTNIRNMLSSKWWNNKSSDIKLVYLYSTIKMMHGPINLSTWYTVQTLKIDLTLFTDVTCGLNFFFTPKPGSITSRVWPLDLWEVCELFILMKICGVTHFPALRRSYKNAERIYHRSLGRQLGLVQMTTPVCRHICKIMACAGDRVASVSFMTLWCTVTRRGQLWFPALCLVSIGRSRGTVATRGSIPPTRHAHQSHIILKYIVGSDVWLTVHRNSEWIR